MRSRLAILVICTLLISLAGGIGLWVWADTEPRVSRLTAGFNYGLLVGAVVAAVGLLEQVIEARRARQDALRPVVIVIDAWPDSEMDEGPPRLVLRNIGPGPALKVQIEVWATESMGAKQPGEFDVHTFLDSEGREIIANGRSADLGHPWPLSLPPNSEVSVPLWIWGGPSKSIGPSDRLRYRITFDDVFRNQFVEPSGRRLGHVWAKDAHSIEGDHDVHFR